MLYPIFIDTRSAALTRAYYTLISSIHRTMASNAKTRRLDCGTTAVDRISNLPTNLTDLILERLPLHDAARTSILSKTWRAVWGMHPNLVFDEAFFSQLVFKRDKQAQLSEVTRTISNILLVNRGPILKFHLSVPQYMPVHHCLDMDLWIKNISDNGVRKLELFIKTPIAYKMPSYLFSCLELTRLNLSNCILNPPRRFGGFCNLISIKLVNVKFTAEMSFGTRLKLFALDRCTGIEHLGCQFKYDNKNLTQLIIINSGEIVWQWFECTQKVENLAIILKGLPNSREKMINLDKLVGNMTTIKSLTLDGFFLKFLEPRAAIKKRLITTMKSLEFISLHHFGFYDLVQIQYVLCLVRSSPNLRCLCLHMEGKVTSKCGNDLVASRDLQVSSVVQYLQSPIFIDMILDQLQTVKIHEMAGSRAELQFIKLLLASSPLLRLIKLINTAIDDPKEELRISKELMSSPRASKAARIMWT